MAREAGEQREGLWPAAPCQTALVLAGGNALGAYQAGVYEALHDSGMRPDWVVGTSAGAINGAIIAGNTADARVERLAALWRPGTARDADASPQSGTWWAEATDTWRRTSSAVTPLLAGQPGLFTPVGTSMLGGSGGTPALYDTAPLAATLASLVDVERLNSGAVRYTATAVDFTSGADIAFDTHDQRIGLDHVRASAALPPAYPAVPIEGRLYVDGGLSANLPLDPVLSCPPSTPTICIAIDLLPRGGETPTSLGSVIERAQDLMLASQSKRSIRHWRDVHAARGPDCTQPVTVVCLSYRDQQREVAGKAMDFSPASARFRWDAGVRDGTALVAALDRRAFALDGSGFKLFELNELLR